MSILKRLRDALRIRSHHGEPTRASQYRVPFRRLGRLFREKSRPKQCSTVYGTNERKESYPAEDKESPPIIPPFAFDVQSTSWPSLLDVTSVSATVAPAQIIGQSPTTQDDAVTNAPTTGATLSSQFSRPRIVAVPPLNLPATGATASLLLDQLTVEPRLSPPNTRPFRFLSLPTVSLDDLSFADVIDHAPDNEDGDAGKVLTAEATISLSSSLLDVSSASSPAAGPICHIFGAEDANASNASVIGITASSQFAQPTTEYRSSTSDILLFRPHSFSAARLDGLAPVEFTGHPSDNEDGDARNVPTAEATPSLPTGTYFVFNAEDRKTANVPIAGPPISLQLAQLTTERGASPTSIPSQSLSTVSLDDPAPADIGHTPNNEDRDAGNVPAAEATVSPQTGSCVHAHPTDDALLKTI